MSLRYDAEYEAATAEMRASMPKMNSISGGNAATAHKSLNAIFTQMMSHVPPSTGVKQSQFEVPSTNGHKVTVYANVPEGATKSTSADPAIIYLHGGGFMAGTAAIAQPAAALLAQQTSRPVFNVDYRLTTTAPFPAATDDIYATLRYLQTHGGELNVNPARIALFGESAGGALAFGTALQAAAANDEHPGAAAVVAAYPMLDDRTVEPAPAGMADKLIWTAIDNTTGWKAYLGERYQKADRVPGVAAPARATDAELARLPPCYIDVGGLDILLAEGIDFAARLAANAVPVELHVFPGVPHGFEGGAPDITPSKMALEARIAALRRF